MYNNVIVIKENVIRIGQRIASACRRAGRDPAEITVIAVTKNRGIEEIKEALANGLADIGENRVQEALLKYNGLRDASARWHLIGHLQTNKAGDAVKMFTLIHSVDSLHLAEEINKQAAKINKIQDILIEVNISGEASKFGVGPAETAALIKNISGLKNINVKGLMTVAPIVEDPETARPYFRRLRELKDQLKLAVLSMGMTGDFEAAVEEGATMVRLGRAIFEG